MTGFARVEGSSGSFGWFWEVRSVNGRGLDIRLRLPPGFESLEMPVREAVAKRVARGSLAVTLTVTRQTSGTRLRLNETALADVLVSVERLQQLTGCERPRADGLLALRGVLEVVDGVDDEAETARRNAALLTTLDEALSGLLAARAAEGTRLGAVLAQQFAEIERLLAALETSPARALEAVKARLAEQVARLMGPGQTLDPARLHQEAVLLAVRADVEEELSRLRAHLDAARELVAEPGAVGRRLDFLAQELNREANTLCAKAADAEISRAGLALKAVIDQVREQVQNIE